MNLRRLFGFWVLVIPAIITLGFQDGNNDSYSGLGPVICLGGLGIWLSLTGWFDREENNG